MSYLKIEYWNSVDLGDVLYQTGYKNRLYLDVEVERPDYNTTIESDLNGDNQELPRFKKWEKVYKFRAWMQEDLLDAFTFMQLHDSIEITLQTGDTIYVDQLRVEYEWEEAGCLADVTVSFTEDYVVAGNCNENMNLDCYCDSPTEIEGFTDIADIGTTTGTAGDLRFFYVAGSSIVGVVYFADLYRLRTTGQFDWVVQESVKNTCYDDGADNWMQQDSGFVIIMPGAVAGLFLVVGLTYNITAYGIPEGTFVDILYSGAASGSFGVYRADEFVGSLINVTFPMAGNYDVEFHVYTHTCDYGNSEKYNVNIP